MKYISIRHRKWSCLLIQNGVKYFYYPKMHPASFINKSVQSTSKGGKISDNKNLFHRFLDKALMAISYPLYSI